MNAFHQFGGSLDSIVFQCKRQHSSKISHLLLGDIVIGMVGKSWPEHMRHLGMLTKVFGDFPAVEAMTFHAKMEGLDPAKYKKTILRSGYCSARIGDEE